MSAEPPEVRIVAEKLRDTIDHCQQEYDLCLAEMIGILETLKLELFIEQRE